MEQTAKIKMAILKRKQEPSEPGPKELKKRKKKKSFEPWGKKERYWVFFVLLGTILTSGVLAFSARSWKLPGLPRISLPSFGSGKIIIENEANDERAERVVSSFKEKTRGLSGVYGLYVFRLTESSSYGVSEKEKFQAASLIKLPVMLALYMEDEKGSIDLETRYELKEEDKVGGAGSLFSKPAGTVLTYRDLVRYMGKQSDNTAYNIASNILGEEKVKSVISEIGMANTSLENNETTPYDIGLFFKKLWEARIVSKKSRDEILGFLTDTSYEEWLVAGIPPSIRVAHKYGRETHVVNDAGIVYADERFILVIMSKGVVEREADEIFPELTEMVYEGEAD